jgi:hypothetical protein
MRSLMLTLLAATIVAFTVPSAVAQSDIDLGGEKVGTLAFVATGAGNFTLGLCDKLNFNRKCVSGDTVIGAASGDGSLGSSGFYNMTGGGLTTGTSTGCAAGVCNWTLSTATPYNFKFTQFQNGTGTQYLTGTIVMKGLTEVKDAHDKLFSETITLDLTVTGGSLASVFASTHGNVVFNVQSQTTLSLAVSPSGRGIQGILESGDMSAAPEPGTLALLGSGFLLVGGFLRRRFTA